MIQRIIFLLTYPLIWGISVLPHRLFYTVSDLLSRFVFGWMGSELEAEAELHLSITVFFLCVYVCVMGLFV